MSKKPLFPVTYGIPEVHSGLVEYHICSNGIFMTKKVAGRGYVTLKIEGIPGIGEGTEQISVLPNKIPISFFWKITEFFKKVEKTFDQGLEAYILLGYNYKLNEYFLWVPPHTVSMASVKYDISQFPNLFPDSYILLDCHSHGSAISGYFSGTDDKDDNRERFSMVIGKINNLIPEYKIRFSTMGKFFDFSLDDIFTSDDKGSYSAVLNIEAGIKNIKVVNMSISKGSDCYSGCNTNGSRGFNTNTGTGRSLYESIRYQGTRGFSIADLMGTLDNPW